MTRDHGPPYPRAVPKISNIAGPVSGYLARWASKIPNSPWDMALDLPCGGGRHALHLAELGYSVVAVDLDARRLSSLADSLSIAPKASIHMALADATKPLPLKEGVFALVVTTHFVSSAWLDQVPSLLRSGGYFIYESFGGQGENWRALPGRGEVAAQLANRFDLVDYRERPCGPTEVEAVAVQAVARLR